MSRRLPPTAFATGAAALAFAVALAGCAPSSEAPTPEPAITVTHTATPAPVAATPAEAAPLTAPGSALDSGEPMVVPVAAADDTGSTTEVVVSLALGSVTPADVDDIADVLSDSEVAGLWNHHPVLVEYTATVSGRAVPEGYTVTEPVAVTGVTTTGDQATAPPSVDAPAVCPAMDVQALSLEGTATGCWTLMVKNDAELASVQYRGSFVGSAAAYTSDPVTWDVG